MTKAVKEFMERNSHSLTVRPAPVLSPLEIELKEILDSLNVQKGVTDNLRLKLQESERTEAELRAAEAELRRSIRHEEVSMASEQRVAKHLERNRRSEAEARKKFHAQEKARLASWGAGMRTTTTSAERSAATRYGKPDLAAPKHDQSPAKDSAAPSPTPSVNRPPVSMKMLHRAAQQQEQSLAMQQDHIEQVYARNEQVSAERQRLIDEFGGGFTPAPRGSVDSARQARSFEYIAYEIGNLTNLVAALVAELRANRPKKGK